MSTAAAAAVAAAYRQFPCGRTHTYTHSREHTHTQANGQTHNIRPIIIDTRHTTHTRAHKKKYKLLQWRARAHADANAKAKESGFI